MENSDSAPKVVEKVPEVQDDPAVIILAPAHPAVLKMGEMFVENRKGPVQTLDSTEILEKQIRDGLHCVVVISVAKDSNLANSLSFMNNIRAFSKKGTVRIIVISKVYNENLRNALTARGANEFLNDKTSPSTLFFKATLFFGQLQRLVGKQLGEDVKKVAGSRKDSSKQDNITVRGGQVSVVEAIAEDVWLIKGIPPKKIGVQWVVEAEGPDPDSGNWEFVGQSDNHQEQWMWKPRGADGKELAKNPEEAWNFAGNRPVFDTESKKWRFVGTKPDLSYQKKGKSVGSKVRLDPEAGMIVAADAPGAEEKLKESRRVGEIVKAERDKETQAKIAAIRAKEMADSEARLKNGAAADDSEDEEGLNSKEAGEDDEEFASGGSSGKEKKASRLSQRKGKSAQDEEAREASGLGKTDEETDAELENRLGRKLTPQEKEQRRQERKVREEEAEEAQRLGLKLNDEDETQDSLRGKGLARDEKTGLSRRGAQKQEEIDGALRSGGRLADEADEAGRLKGREKNKEDQKDSRKKPALDKDGKPIPSGRFGKSKNGDSNDGEDEAGDGLQAKGGRDSLGREKKADRDEVDPLDAALGRSSRPLDSERGGNYRQKSKKESELDQNGNPLKEKSAAERAAAGGKSAKGLNSQVEGENSASSGHAGLSSGEDGVELSDWEDEKRRKRPGIKMGADEEAQEVIQKNYVFRRTNGKLRASKGEVGLERVPSSEFGSDQGCWEPVGEMGWMFMTPEMKSKGLDAIKDLEPYWYLDRERGATAPFYDEKTKTWLFNDEQTASKAGTFDHLPKDYQNHLMKGAETPKTLEAATAENEAQLKEANALTAKTFEAFTDIETNEVTAPMLSAEAGIPEALTSDSKKSKGPSHLGFFLKLSDMLNSGKSRDEVYQWMTGYILDAVKADHVFLLMLNDPNSLETTVLASTNPGLKIGHNFDLGKTLFRDAPKLKDKKLVQLSETKQVALHPVIRALPTELNVGVLIVQVSTPSIPLMNANDHFFIQLRKQLSRLIVPPAVAGSPAPAKGA